MCVCVCVCVCVCACACVCVCVLHYAVSICRHTKDTHYIRDKASFTDMCTEPSFVNEYFYII